MVKSIKEQYEALGAEEVLQYGYEVANNNPLPDFDELVLISNPAAKNAVEADNEAVELLKSIAEEYTAADGLRPVVHLLLQSQTSLWMLQTMDMPEVVNEKFEVYPFTMEDLWAKNVLVHLPGIKNTEYPVLDRESIGKDSKRFIHVVISGFDEQAMALATHVALVAHYPNYDSEAQCPLRTRITIITEDVKRKRDVFVAKYQHLFDNSFHRTIDLKERTVDFHRPMYWGRRGDLVDVEWEFVDAGINHPEVCSKIEQWVSDKKHQLTFFISNGNDEQNLAECLALPRMVYENEIPVIVQQSRREFMEPLTRSALYKTVHPFGMNDCGYDVTLPLVQLAKYLKYFYDCSYGNVGVPTELPVEEVNSAWCSEKSFKMRFSSIYNVMTIATKMRSLGHAADDTDAFYALTQSEIEMLAETEHNRWSVERLIQGTRPCTDAETEEIRTNVKELKKAYKKRDIHFDLRAYGELEEDGTGKNAQVYDYDLTACIPLIVKTFCEEHGDGK